MAFLLGRSPACLTQPVTSSIGSRTTDSIKHRSRPQRLRPGIKNFLSLTTPGSGAGDQQADTVIVTGTTGDDAAVITGTSAGVNVLGLAATVNLVASEPTLDQLIIRLLAGDDV